MTLELHQHHHHHQHHDLLAQYMQSVVPRVFGEQIDNHDVWRSRFYTCLRLESGAVVSTRASDARYGGFRR